MVYFVDETLDEIVVVIDALDKGGDVVVLASEFEAVLFAFGLELMDGEGMGVEIGIVALVVLVEQGE